MKDTSFETRRYGQKRVFIFEDHAVALRPWSLVRMERDDAPLLFTLDHHTDVQTGPVGAFDFRDSGQVEEAARAVKNDEHIDVAIRSKVIDAAVVLPANGMERTQSKEQAAAYNNPVDLLFGNKKPGPRPHHYNVPSNRIFCLPVDGARDRPGADHVLETDFLEDKLGHAKEMLAALPRRELLFEPFILDIDLDYFQTSRSLEPVDSTLFHSLLRQSIAVTVATEPRFVERVRLESAVTAEASLAGLEKYFVAAFGPRAS